MSTFRSGFERGEPTVRRPWRDRLCDRGHFFLNDRDAVAACALRLTQRIARALEDIGHLVPLGKGRNADRHPEHHGAATVSSLLVLESGAPQPLGDDSSVELPGL